MGLRRQSQGFASHEAKHDLYSVTSFSCIRLASLLSVTSTHVTRNLDLTTVETCGLGGKRKQQSKQSSWGRKWTPGYAQPTRKLRSHYPQVSLATLGRAPGTVGGSPSTLGEDRGGPWRSFPRAPGMPLPSSGDDPMCCFADKYMDSSRAQARLNFRTNLNCIQSQGFCASNLPLQSHRDLKRDFTAQCRQTAQMLIKNNQNDARVCDIPLHLTNTISKRPSRGQKSLYACPLREQRNMACALNVRSRQ